MALTIGQMAAAAYPLVLAEMRKPMNQWADNAALKELERVGALKRVSFGENIELPLDYRRNPDAAVLASDQEESPNLKTEVITAAVFDIAQISVPVTYTKYDDMRTPDENRKIDFVESLLKNAIETHDDIIEQAIFTTTASGGVELAGLDTLVPTSGAGTVGGINAAVETWWANFADTYTDASDIEAAMTEAWNEAAKGSGSPLAPSLLISGAEAHATYEAALQSFQRFMSSGEADGGFKVLAFKSARYVFSQFGDDKIYFLNPKNFQLLVSKQYFRDQGETQEFEKQNAFGFKIYSGLQFVTNQKSRLAVLSRV